MADLSGEPPRTRGTLRKDWALALLLALLSLGLVCVELWWLRSGSMEFSDARYLPFIAAVAWLKPPATLLLGLWVLSLKPLLQAFNTAALEVTSPQWHLQLTVEVAAVALCIWLCQLRCRLQQTRAKLHRALQNSLNTSALIHDVRQPIAALVLQCRALLYRQEEQDQRDPDLHTKLMELLDSAETLASTSESAWSLLRSCNPGRRSAVELSTLVRSQLNVHARVLQEATTTLQCQGLEQEVWLWADGGQLQLLLNNLISNAITALNGIPGTQRILRVGLDVDRSRQQICLTVADSGPGLPSLKTDELCLRSHGRSGLGLGLFIAKQVAQQHGGALQLGHSQELGGAQVRVMLSLAYKPS